MRKITVTLQYDFYLSNAGKIQYVLIAEKGSKKVLHTIKECHNKDIREDLMEKAREYCRKQGYIVDIAY